MKEPVGTGGNDGDERKRSDERRDSTNQRLSSGARHLDSISNVLTERRRRYAPYYLQEREVCDVDDLARHVATVAVESSTGEAARLERTKVQLVHTDLPILAEGGLVDYDSRSEAVRYADPPSLSETTLMITRKIDTPKAHE